MDHCQLATSHAHTFFLAQSDNCRLRKQPSNVPQSVATFVCVGICKSSLKSTSSDTLASTSLCQADLAVARASWVTQHGHNNSHGHPVRDRKAPASSFHAAMAAVSNTRDVARSHVAAAVQRHRALAVHNQRTHGRGDARRTTAPRWACATAFRSRAGPNEHRPSSADSWAWAGMGKEGWLVVAAILIATRMAMSATALPGRR